MSKETLEDSTVQALRNMADRIEQRKSKIESVQVNRYANEEGVQKQLNVTVMELSE